MQDFAGVDEAERQVDASRRRAMATSVLRSIRRWLIAAFFILCLLTVVLSLYMQSFFESRFFDHNVISDVLRYHLSSASGSGSSGSIVSVEEDDLIYANKRLSPVVIERYKLIFFDVPKVASSAWMILFQKMSGVDRSKLKFPNLVRHAVYSQLKYLYRYNLSYATQIMNDPNWVRATFVRNPHERLLSAYLDKGVSTKFKWIKGLCCKSELEGNDGKSNSCVHNIVPTNDGLRTTLKHHIRKDECLPKDKQSFADFIDFVPKCHNDHWYPQSERMDAKHWALINFVGSMDNLQGDAKALLEQVGAWDEFGRTGWGPDSTDPIFGSDSTNIVRNHSHAASEKMIAYYGGNSHDLYHRVTEYYRRDYNHEVLRLPLHPPPEAPAD